jgi:hypothetical protein
MAALLMFAHPQCPCSRASMGELALIMTHAPQKVQAQVLFLRPKDYAEDWVKTDLWRSAAAIPGVQAVVDEQGREAGLFHAGVSGQVMLYDPRGNLVFSGGITSSRGHSGDNDGREAIEDYLNKGVMPVKSTPFFGCALFDHGSGKAPGEK